MRPNEEEKRLSGRLRVAPCEGLVAAGTIAPRRIRSPYGCAKVRKWSSEVIYPSQARYAKMVVGGAGGYCSRSAVAGSIRAARAAGSQHATTVMTATVTIAPMYTDGSRSLMP